MYGSRARLGLVVPANNTVIEPELNRLCPPGVSVHATRVLGNRGGAMAEGPIHVMEASADSAVDCLTVSRVQVILYCCMATGLIKGPGWAREFSDRLRGRTEVPVAAASDLTMQALQALGVRRVAIVTPYPEHVAERVAPFFRAHGFHVVAERHLAGTDIQSVNDHPPETAYRLARSLDLSAAQGVCILATDFRTVEALAPLEGDLGLPVVSTNQAVLWGGLRLSGVTASIPGYGRLLADTVPLPDPLLPLESVREIG